jgi:hypothetical protein
MSDQLAAAAAALNVPETIVQRSAEAKAKASGASVDDILAAWAGGGPAPEASAPAAPAESETAPEVDDTPDAPSEPAAAPTEPEAPAPSPAAAPAAPSRPPAPERVSPEEALSHPVVVSVPTAGLKERTVTSLPRWLAAAFMVVPLFGLLYLTSNITSAGCTEGGFELAVDRVTGFGENCDGSAFEGRAGASGPGAAFIGEGRGLYTSVGCAGCHGANGGGGQGPAFANVLATFSSCADHIEWVLLGSAGYQALGLSTYGDLAQPIAGGMPGHANLTQDQLASVVAFERVAYGGGVADEVLADCGLVEAPADGEAPADDAPGADSTPTTVGGEARVGAAG